MNQNLIKNTAYNYLHDYRLNMVHLEDIQQLVVVVKKKKYHIYKRLCELAPNSQVIDNKYWFVVKIDYQENRDLVDNLQKLFFKKVLKKATPDTKVGNHALVGNLFKKLKMFK